MIFGSIIIKATRRSAEALDLGPAAESGRSQRCTRCRHGDEWIVRSMHDEGRRANAPQRARAAARRMDGYELPRPPVRAVAAPNRLFDLRANRGFVRREAGAADQP